MMSVVTFVVVQDLEDQVMSVVTCVVVQDL